MYVNPRLPSCARNLLADLAGPSDIVLPGLALGESAARQVAVCKAMKIWLGLTGFVR